MKNQVYVLMALTPEPMSLIVGEMGHEIVGIYSDLQQAQKVARQLAEEIDFLGIYASKMNHDPKDATDFRTREVYRIENGDIYFN